LEILFLLYLLDLIALDDLFVITLVGPDFDSGQEKNLQKNLLEIYFY
jgi:hypothetical protein